MRSRHGELSVKNGHICLERGRGVRGGWWSKIVRLLNGVAGKWFTDNLRLNLGNGLNTSFWGDRGRAQHRLMIDILDSFI